MNRIDRWLNEPQLGALAVGSAEWFRAQRKLIDDRPLVHGVYADWYQKMLADAGTVVNGGAILELGSGPNFVKGLDPSVVTSDIVAGTSDLVVDAQHLPFPNSSLKAILLTHVFHHIPKVDAFLNESVRTLVPGGVISMIDVAHTPFAKLFFTFCHPEGYDDRRVGWDLDEREPVGGANQALTWMVLVRDAATFTERFPALRIEIVEHLPWFAYLLSGGLTRRNVMPAAAVPIVKILDRARSLDNVMSLHWHIRIRKVT